MQSEAGIVVWDTSVIIDAIQKTPGRIELLEPFIGRAEAGKLQIVVSEISVGETQTLKMLSRQGVSEEDQVQLIMNWFLNPYIVRRPVHAGISDLAARLCRNHKFNKNKGILDAMIVATALFWEIPLLHTFDGDGDNPGLIDLDRQVGGDPPLRICRPDYDEGTLMEGTAGQ